MLTLFLALAAAPQVAAPVAAAAPLPSDPIEADWRAIPDDELLVMQLGDGKRVVIRLAAAYAPAHVANVRRLALAHWWDGLSVYRVQENWVTQWGDRTEQKPLPAGVTDRPAAEFEVAAFRPAQRMGRADPYSTASGVTADGWPVATDGTRGWLTHCYGMVGVARDALPSTGSGAELFTPIGQSARRLDRNYTVVGRIVEGMQWLSALPRSDAPMGMYAGRAEELPIVTVRLASDIPAADRPRYQYRAADNPRFAAAIARREHPEPPTVAVGGASVCDVGLPVREAPSRGQPGAAPGSGIGLVPPSGATAGDGKAAGAAADGDARNTPPGAPGVTYIHAGTLLDRPGERPRGPTTIVVRGGRIAELRDGFAPPEAGARLIDLRDRFVLPGLIDMHVHLLGIGGDPLRARLTALNTEPADDVLYGAGNARATLLAGFTTVRDLGGDPRSIRALRDAVARGDVDGPTIVNAGAPISVTGGHGDPLNGIAEPFAHAVAETVENTCDGPADCTRATRRQVGLGAEVVKITATGGVLSNVAGGLGRAFTPEEMRAIVDTAHNLGRKVAAHSHAADGTKAALAAGVDSIEHGSFLDDEAIAALKRTGAYLVPTELAPVAALAQARAGLLPPATVPKAEAAAAAMVESHRRAYRAGVKFAFGTDTGVSKHGDNAREFALLVEKVGMTPAEAIRTATVAAADLLGRTADLGTIAPGKAADIIAVAGSPLDDVRQLERIRFVMHKGVVAKGP